VKRILIVRFGYTHSMTCFRWHQQELESLHRELQNQLQGLMCKPGTQTLLLIFCDISYLQLALWTWILLMFITCV